MKVEIWSDIACPFCYIGKRKFEKALKSFNGSENVEVVWRSFQLDPHTKYEPGKSIHDYLADKKGMSTAQAKEMNDYVSDMAASEGLNYQLDKTIPANTFDAHRLIHLAAKEGLQDKAEERLFSAYFIEGENIEDRQALLNLGKEIGLDETEINQMLNSKDLQKEVEQDFIEARRIGVRGVPFFLFNEQFAVSGAQPSEVFIQALEKAGAEETPQQQMAGTCDVDGNCS